VAMSCPPPERLRDWVDGRLDDAAAAAVGDHAETCPDCQAALDSMLPGRLSAASGDSISAFVRRLAGSLPAEVRNANGDRAGSDSRPPASAHGTLPPSGTVPAARPATRFPELPDYEVIRVLGRGGMGVVYLARHWRLKRLTAIKVLSERLEEPRHLARFRTEAEILARLRHPNVVQVYDVSEADGRPFLAMEYVDGGTLSALCRDRPLEPGEAARLVEEIARGVHAAHRVGIVHRDLKPANVLIDGGMPKVTDFGLAKDLDSGDSLTPTGAVVGTPQYMAPEQVVLGPEADSASVDVYALGAILYDLLTGRPPHVGSNAYETLDLVRRRVPLAPSRRRPGLPAELERICLRCLEKKPAKRFASAEAVADALAAFRATWTSSAAVAPVARGRRAALFAVPVLTLASLAFVAVAYMSGKEETPFPDRPDLASESVSTAPAQPLDPLPAGSVWIGDYTFLPAPDGRVDGDARLKIESREAGAFTGVYSSFGGEFAWKVRGVLQDGRVRWEFTDAIRDNAEKSVVGRVSVDGMLAGDTMNLRWRQPLTGEEARLDLRRAGTG